RCQSSRPGKVSDGAGRSNLCPQLCPVVGTSLRGGKKASRKFLLRLAFRMSGRLDSNQRPPEPHSRSAEGELFVKYVSFASYGFLSFCNSTRIRPFFKLFSAQLCPAPPSERPPESVGERPSILNFVLANVRKCAVHWIPRSVGLIVLRTGCPRVV